jgi:hypothetical protein
MKTFEIFNVNSPLMSKNELISAESPINAIKDYLRNKNINLKPKKSGSNYVQVSAREVIENNGRMYYKGNVQWYELTEN